MQWEFVESIVFQCLFYPSATWDRFTFVATNALHPVRMAADATYADRLPLDPNPGKEGKFRFPSRKKSEAQLELIAASLDGGASLAAALKSLVEDGYLALIRNFRNLSSHVTAPRLTVGHTSTVVQCVVLETMMVRQPDGSYKDELAPGKQRVSYGFGGTDPLPMHEVFAGSLAEFEKTAACFHAYVGVLDKAPAGLPKQ